VVRVEWTVERGLVAIRVIDRGLGIPKNEQAAVFRKFVRGQSSVRANVKGTGVDKTSQLGVLSLDGSLRTLTSLGWRDRPGASRRQPPTMQRPPAACATSRSTSSPLIVRVHRFVESRGRPSWSADGKALVYVSCRPSGGGPDKPSTGLPMVVRSITSLRDPARRTIVERRIQSGVEREVIPVPAGCQNSVRISPDPTLAGCTARIEADQTTTFVVARMEGGGSQTVVSSRRRRSAEQLLVMVAGQPRRAPRPCGHRQEGLALTRTPLRHSSAAQSRHVEVDLRGAIRCSALGQVSGVPGQRGRAWFGDLGARERAAASRERNKWMGVRYRSKAR
jgi:hypothetical protein